MSMKTGTICSKHDKIMDLSNHICNRISAFKDEIESDLDDLYKLAENCKDDGQRMEDGLYKKKRTIEELEKFRETGRLHN